MAKRSTTYTSRAELIRALESIARKEVKHYLSDWADYDKPALESMSDGRANLVWITRECGTYLLPATAYSFSVSIFDAMAYQIKGVRRLTIDGENATVTKLDPAAYYEDCKRRAREEEAATAAA